MKPKRSLVHILIAQWPGLLGFGLIGFGLWVILGAGYHGRSVAWIFALGMICIGYWSLANRDSGGYNF